MFDNLKKAINAHYDGEAEKFAAQLEDLTVGAALDSWYYRDRMTAAALKMAQGLDEGEKLPEAVRVKMLRRFSHENEKKRLERLEKLEQAAAYSSPASFSVSTEWKKSRVWGYNPTATACAMHLRTQDSASGCGYDKGSAAIAGAFNRNPEIMRILYEHAEKGGAFPYSVHTFAGLPSFDGGCGISCFGPVFDACGYEWRNVASGRLFDAFTCTKKAEA
jgi:hypothetical protein